nr:MAG TPA: hypothetical protein [Caudoviricetes sp.]
MFFRRQHDADSWQDYILLNSFTYYALRLNNLLKLFFRLKLASQPLCLIPRYRYSLPHSKDWQLNLPSKSLHSYGSQHHTVL